jgi:uncharacterized membrane-anchored protein
MVEARLTLSERTRLIVLVVTTVVILALVNTQIAGKERIVRDGATVLLALAPVDPRSLMQGDYMALRYALAGDVAEAADAAEVADGEIVIEVDESGVARFVALHDGEPLASGQHLLQFRVRGETVRLASDAFFFEEGQGETYARARFGELRVDTNGSAVLIGLRDQNVEPIEVSRLPIAPL